jgi:mRNA-degrading endonuclease toxin of MazEF toxin-antitoxin module
VLADLPFSDRSGVKKRPALIVQCDRNNNRLDDVIVAMITSVVQRVANEPTQRLIDPKSPEGQTSGLLHPSAVKCEHLITLHRQFISRIIGHIPADIMVEIDNCLKESLGLS